MNATFTHAIRYQVEAECMSPMRSGGNDRDTEQILRRWDGFPIVQGTSLAGAMRSWFDAQDAENLFGSQQQEGAVSVSDIVFESTAATSIRPRLRINGATGTADNGGKFDVMHLETGTKGSFCVIWKGCSLEERDQAAQKLEQCFAAMHAGLIRLGAQKSNGFGSIAVTVQRRCYDMTKQKDRTAWIEEKEGAVIQLPPLKHIKNIVLHVSMDTDALLVKSGARQSVSDADRNTKNLTVSIRENGRAVIPGSSLKGAVRAQLTRSAAFLCSSEDELNDMFGRASSENDNGIAGKVLFSDGSFCEQKEKTAVQTRIRIDRLSGGVMDKALVQEEILGGTCSWDIVLSPYLAQPERTAALLLFALRDLGIGLYSLGSGSAIGRGRAQNLTVTAGSSVLTCKDGNAEISDENGLFASWVNALRGETR